MKGYGVSPSTNLALYSDLCANFYASPLLSCLMISKPIWSHPSELESYLFIRAEKTTDPIHLILLL